MLLQQLIVNQIPKFSPRLTLPNLDITPNLTKLKPTCQSYVNLTFDKITPREIVGRANVEPPTLVYWLNAFFNELQQKGENDTSMPCLLPWTTATNKYHNVI